MTANGETTTPAVNGGGNWQSRVVDRSLERATRRSLERGRAFIDATLTLLDRSGTTGFTVQEVADEAGVSLRIFYQHFSGKDDLILAVFEEMCTLHGDVVAATLEGVTDPADRLRTVLSAAIRSKDDQPQNRVRAFIAYRNALATTHPDQIAAAEAPYASVVRGVIQEAIDSGVATDYGVDKMTWFLTSTRTAYIHAAVLRDDLGLDLPTPDEIADLVLRAFGGSSASS